MRALKYNDHGKKWLFVKNWDKYQPPARMMSKQARCKWIRDYTDKLDNYDYQQLTGYERSIYEGVCLLVGDRPLRSVPNDPIWIGHALHLVRADIPHVGRALTRLVNSGFFEPAVVESREDDARHQHDTGTAPSQHPHGTVTAPARHLHGTTTAPSQHLENSSVDEDSPEELQENRGRDRDREPDADRDTQVSESVSQLVSECSPEPLGYEGLGEGSKAIVNCLYPRFNPPFGSIQPYVPALEEVSKALTASGWRALFGWNRTHKPDKLVFRSLPQFLSGAAYALNDYTAHDPALCTTCKPKEKGAKA